MKTNVKKILPILLLLLVLAAIWEVTATDRITFFFSKPSEIGVALIDDIKSGRAISDFIFSFYATILGLSIGIIFGMLSGFITFVIPKIRFIVFTLVSLFLALPILAIAPMFLIWFGTGLALKISLATLMVSLLMASETINARKQVSKTLYDWKYANKISDFIFARKITIPYIIQYIFSKLPAAANTAFLGVFVGEFIAADRGVGYRILRAGSLYQIDHVLASTISALLLLLTIQLLTYVVSAAVTQFVQRSSID